MQVKWLQELSLVDDCFACRKQLESWRENNGKEINCAEMLGT